MPSHAASWLSEGAEVLAHELGQSIDDEFDCDVLIVGSGYGGAVAAARLAGSSLADGAGGRRDARVWVVERGREYLRGMFPSRFAELPGHIRFSQQDGKPARGYAEALFDVRLGDDAHVLLGNGLGGGSLINAGVMEEPADGVWSDGWPITITRCALDDGYQAALTMLQPTATPVETKKFKMLAAIASAASAAGAGPAASADLCRVAVNFTPNAKSAAGIDMTACTHCGDCMTGCNQGAKATLDTNYLALAAQRGARLFCGATVERLIAAPNARSGWEVRWHHTEPRLRPADGQAMAIRARCVVLAAGSLGSTEILLRSRSAELQFSPRLGAQFSTNGDMVAAVYRHHDRVDATADQETDPADPAARHVGPTITGLARTRAGTHAGVGPDIAIEEFAVPGALSQVFGEIVSSLGILSLTDEVLTAPGGIDGQDPMAATGSAITHSGLYGFMGNDGARGRLELASAPNGVSAVDAAVRIVWPELRHLPLFDAQVKWLKSICEPGDLPAAGPAGGHVIFNPLWKPFGSDVDSFLKDLKNKDGQIDSLPVGPPLTVHPLGGCAMGDTVAQGVVDAAGRVFRADGALHGGLAVLDGAIIPRALGINPALTIAAVAEQAVLVLRKAWALQAPSKSQGKTSALSPRPVWAGRRPPERGATAARIREAMQGPITLDGRHYWARLDVQFEEIGDLSALLLKTDKDIPVKSAHLTLYSVAAGVDEFNLPELPAPAAKARLTGRLRLLLPQPPDEGMWRTLTYELSIESIELNDGDALVDGQAVVGVKDFGASGQPWRELTELRLSIDSAEVGTLSLDLDDLASRREPLLSVTRQSSAPDGLADLAGLGLLLLRVYLRAKLIDLLPEGDYPPALIIDNLNARYPGPLRSGRPEIHAVGPHGARLSRYLQAGEVRGRPVLMIHGFGASGSTFAHPSIPVNLVEYVQARGREAWVLDLRTSIGNEPEPGQPRSGPWTFDEVAHEDIPAALQVMAGHVQQPIDVIAHCIGAAMFCIAALDDASVRPLIGAVVLSQVGPVLRMSPANRLRGYLASYLEQFIGAEEFDTRPEYHRIVRNGQIVWEQNPSAPRTVKLVDALLNTLPYPDDDLKLEEKTQAWIGVDFRVVRRRSDAIRGHLMETANVADETWKHLDALNGWVKVRSLAQTIHYARHGVLTDASGRNRSLRRDHLTTRFAFPLLLVHGQRNRVFNWRGSLDSFKLLQRLRGVEDVGQPTSSAAALLWGGDGDQQLLVLKNYGHQDCIVGRNSSSDVFAPMLDFLDAHAKTPNANLQATDRGAITTPGEPQPIQFEPPWIGPVLGWVKTGNTPGTLRVRVLVQPQPRQAQTAGLVFVPLDSSGKPLIQHARGVLPGPVPPPQATPKPFPSAQDMQRDQADRLLYGANTLLINTAVVPAQFESFIALTVHPDLLPISAVVFDAPMSTPAPIEAWADSDRLDPANWLIGGLRLHDSACSSLAKALTTQLADWPAWPLLRLSRPICDAADAADTTDMASSRPRALCFALASCQYPPGLMDAPSAGAGYARLAADCRRTDGPAPQFLLAVGDQVYVDATAGVFDPGADGRPRDVVRKAYELNWLLEPMRQTVARLPMYSMLDDHEVRDNWQPPIAGEPEDTAACAALSEFKHFQGLLNPFASGATGQQYSFSPCGARIIVLDTRSQRQRRRVGSSRQPGTFELESATIVPDDMLQDVFGQLLAAPKDCVKFIVSPSPLLPLERFRDDRPHERLSSDSWSGYPASLMKLLGFIQTKRIQRVVFLSGDAHGSAVSKLVLDDGLAIYSVLSSGMHAPWPFANSRPEEFVLDGPVALRLGDAVLNGQMHTAAWSPHSGYALVSLSAAGDDPHALLRVRLRDSADASIDCQHDLRTPGGAWSVSHPPTGSS